MLESISKDEIFEWLSRIAEAIEENKDYLVELDAVIGDADHGINMDRGFRKVISIMPRIAGNDIGHIMKTVGMALISSVGGASGPLYGTFFLRAADIATGKQILQVSDISKIFTAGVEGVMDQGKARLGDKTMVDALYPAAEAMVQAELEGHPLKQAVQSAVKAAEVGMKSTIPMLAKKGRASYLGERSIGHQDPGATSSYLILKSLMETLDSYQ